MSKLACNACCPAVVSLKKLHATIVTSCDSVFGSLLCFVLCLAVRESELNAACRLTVMHNTEETQRAWACMQVLSLHGCTKVSDEAVAAVVLQGSLHILNVNSITGIGFSTIKALATATRCACMHT